MTFYSNPKRDYVLNPRGKALYDGEFILCCIMAYGKYERKRKCLGTDTTSYDEKLIASTTIHH